MSIIAINIKRVLKERGLKQYSVAERAGYKPNEFSNMLNGRKVIKGDDVQLISTILNIPVNELFAVSDQPKEVDQ